MNNNKITNIEALNLAIIALEDMNNMNEVISKLVNIRTSFEKKASVYTEKKTAKTELNAKLRDAIANMITSEPVTTSEIAFALDISPQKVTYVIKPLIDNNVLTVTVTKGKKYFTKA